MYTRKDIIMHKTKEKLKMKNTDIKTIFSRPYDFKENACIFDHKNEYKNTRNSAHILYNFQNIETWIDEARKCHKPYTRITPERDQAERQNERLKRQIVNVGVDNYECVDKIQVPEDILYCVEKINMGYDDSECVNTNHISVKQTERENEKLEYRIENLGIHDTQSRSCVDENLVPVDFLYCNEELPMSVICEDEINLDDKQEEDPYAVSDDSKDTNYIPEESIGSSEYSDSETIKADNKVSVPAKALSKEANSLQHCEYEHCKLSVLGCCQKCFCLLCPVHFAEMPLSCQKHFPYSIYNGENKENDCNANNYSLPIKRQMLNKKNDENNTDNKYTSVCQYAECKKEIFSTCGYCLCFLCYSHFMNDDTYTDCKNHTPYLPQKQCADKLKIKHHKKKNRKSGKTKVRLVVDKNQEKKNTEKRKKFEKIIEVLKDEKEKENPILPGLCDDKCTNDTGKRRKSLDFDQTKKNLSGIMSTPRKRRHTIDVQLSESSQLLKKRKKYNSTLKQRKNDAKITRIMEHNVKTGCGNKCLKRCSSMFSEQERAIINTTFWNMSWQQQHSFIRAHTELAVPKRKTTSEPKRNPRRTFTLKKGDGTRVEVCKIFLLTTLGYEKTNDRILHNKFTDESTDKRGKHQKTPAFDRSLLTQHIESFHPQVHHYRREHAPLRRYLPSDLNITQMHKNFCEMNPKQTVSYELYRQHMKNMNIGFACLGNEECETCESYNFHKIETSHDAQQQIEEFCTVCEMWAKHNRKYIMARNLYKKHKDEALVNSEKYYSADLEKVIMLPRLDMFKAAIFCRRLVVYNETFAPLGKISTESKPLTVIWHEGIAGRKQNDIISAFYHFLLRNRDVSTLHIWLDNCSAQNKNWLLYSFFVHMINSDEIASEKIILYYFEPGHTFMSCDQVHHQIELAMKKKGKLYDFADFEDAVASINKSKVNVKSMATEDFFTLPNHVSDKRVQNSNPRAYLKDMVQVCFTRNSYDLMYKNDFEDEFIELRFLNEKYIKNPSIMKLEFHSKPKCIEATRKDEIIKTLSSVIPKHKQQFWINLPSIGGVNEKAKETSDTKSKKTKQKQRKD